MTTTLDWERLAKAGMGIPDALRRHWNDIEDYSAMEPEKTAALWRDAAVRFLDEDGRRFTGHGHRFIGERVEYCCTCKDGGIYRTTAPEPMGKQGWYASRDEALYAMVEAVLVAEGKLPPPTISCGSA